MSETYSVLKKLGFKKYQGAKNTLYTDIPVGENDFLSIIITLNGEQWEFKSVEIDSTAASEFVKNNFKTFSNKEIIQAITKTNP